MFALNIYLKQEFILIEDNSVLYLISFVLRLHDLSFKPKILVLKNVRL